ncbi:hypothetical protein QM012_000267 [Aureobasidium pullulans]|uniref:Uncharacterized protein n=1 Tax=Aureobasidium pullulans TaxID=5580 RepID=A0ABR0TVW9_AURPU
MDEATRRAFTQALKNNRSQSTHNHMQPGAEASQPSGQPEHRTFLPNQHASNTRIFSPLASLSTAQSHASAFTPTQHIHQTNTICFPNGVVSSTSSPALQHAYQPVQQQLSSSTGPASSFNGINQHMYQPSRLHPGSPHGQHNRHLFQPRHHPYGAPQSRPSQDLSSYYPQDTLSTLSPGGPSLSPSRPDTPAQSNTPTASQIQTPDRQEFLRYLHGIKHTLDSHNTSQPQNQTYSQMLFSDSTMVSPAQLQVRYSSQSSPAGSSPSASSQVQSPVQSYGRIQLPPRSTPQAPQLSNSTSSRPIRTLQQQPSPPRIWCPDLKTVTYVSLPLQAQPEEESSHPNQSRLVTKTQARALANIHPHEFIDHLTMDHNECFKPKVARAFNMLYMQALLFFKNHVLLVSPKELQTPCWEPAQSIWHAYDLYRPEVTSNTQVERHIYKALNLVSDILPDEVSSDDIFGRHDSAVNLVTTNGKLTYGWSVTVAFDFKDEALLTKFRRISPDRNVGFFSENKIRDLDMIPVWKAKVLEIFDLRRAAKSAQ